MLESVGYTSGDPKAPGELQSLAETKKQLIAHTNGRFFELRMQQKDAKNHLLWSITPDDSAKMS